MRLIDASWYLARLSGHYRPFLMRPRYQVKTQSTKYVNSKIDAYSPSAYRVSMASDPRKLEELAAALDPKERARLALRLIESLDPGTDEDAEALWFEEAEKRLARYDAGETEARPANDVITEIRNKIG